MVKKHDNSWRMCVDFKDLNKACPKDGYPLPEIDWKVESLCGFPFKCFLDTYKGYHQIQMAKEDEEKTAFITSQGIFCYTKMPFGLRNAGATYQRLVDKAFHKQIGRNLEVYVDDLVIKSRTEDEIVRDMEETFQTLREINMKLNPKKCTFGIEEGKFLGYKVSTRRLKVCPDKVDDVLSLPSPRCLKDVQRLNGKLASLNRFLAKSAEKSLPFFKTLKKCTRKSDFYWTTEAEEAFKQMKQLIAELPMLVAPMEKEELIITPRVFRYKRICVFYTYQFSFKCFLDTYKGYHQIQMAKEDEEKIAFITSQGIFCYTKMPFGQRNAGATYQRLVDKAFHKQIGRNLEVYVDDLVIKSRMEDEIVSTRRLKVCQDKVDAVLSLPSPRCLKDVQRLNGKLASLNRFLAKSAEKSIPFFKTLKKCTRKSDFYWTTEAEEAFKQMKQLIAELPIQPTSVVRNTLGKEPVPQDPNRPISDEALREYCDRNYHQILPIIAEKVHQEKPQQKKLKAVKARLNFEETSHHSESGTPIRRRGLKERLGPRYVCSRSESPKPRRGRPESPKKKGSDRNAVFKRLEKGVFHRLGDKGKNVSVYSDDSRRRLYHSSHMDTESCHQSSRSRTIEHASERHYNKRASSKRTEELSESEGSAGGHWKLKVKRPKSSVEDDLSQPWVCEETDPFTPRIRYFDFPKT
ncbi:reverse transcriptase domain-containing protein [Tanacetum coccineum]